MIVSAATYLIVLPSSVDREKVAEHLQSLPGYEIWFYSLPNAVMVNSRQSATELSQDIEKKFGEITHLVVKISGTDHYGRLPKDHWGLFK